MTTASRSGVFTPLFIAIRGKGIPALFKRVHAIGSHYGLTASKMDICLSRFVDLLQQYDCGATFPITGVALTYNGDVVREYQSRGIEFAIHGYAHVDYSALSLDEQVTHLKQALCAFEQNGMKVSGFRCPYLRWNADMLTAIEQQGLVYDSSQALASDVVDGLETEAYRRVLEFYGARSTDDYPSLPRLTGNLVRIPYCLPDDEALVDRLQLTDPEPMAEIWLEVLRRTCESGVLFTLGLHPERVALCEEALRAVLSQARSLSPPVWIARLDEIANWWCSRAETTYRVVKETESSFRLTVNGPPGTTTLARSVAVEAPTEPWMNGYRRVLSNDFVFRADKLPFIGLSLDAPSALISFLQQQGYLVESGAKAQLCGVYLDRTDFTPEDARPLLAQMARGTWPLLRLARWPDGAQSALSVTGDIDALTLWDYALRVFSG